MSQTQILKLQKIFNLHLELMDLHLYNTSEKMMKILRNEGDSNWTTEQILNWADNNKIPWIQGSDDDEDYDTYVKSMNARLAEILRT